MTMIFTRDLRNQLLQVYPNAVRTSHSGCCKNTSLLYRRNLHSTEQPHISGYYLLANNEVIKIHSQFETTDHPLHPGRKLATSKVMHAYIFCGVWSQFGSLKFYFIKDRNCFMFRFQQPPEESKGISSAWIHKKRSCEHSIFHATRCSESHTSMKP